MNATVRFMTGPTRHRRRRARSRARSLVMTFLAVAVAAAGLVVATPPPPAQAAPGKVLIADNAQWRYWRNAAAPAANWMSPSFVDSGWPSGAAPLGAGDRLTDSWLGTRMTVGSPAPLVSYFRRSFQWTPADGAVTFQTWADDGAAIFVNGVEVSRLRLDAGVPITHSGLWANAAISTTNALGQPWVVKIPSKLLKSGNNVIAAAVVANYRLAKDVSFGGKLTATPSVADGTVLVRSGSSWQYWRANQEPEVAWKFSPQDVGWRSGKAPLGYGTTGLGTTLDKMANPPLSTYFRYRFNLDNVDALPDGARFTTIADDGVVVYVNGHDIGRYRVDDVGAAMFSSTWANAAVNSSTARNEPVTFKVPRSYLRQGMNVISAQVIANYRSTNDISFDGTLVAGGGGAAAQVTRPDPSLKPVWSDEFNGTEINRTNWDVENNSTYGDGGLQTECLMDRKENQVVRNGKLIITARREATPFKCGDKDTRFPQGRNFTSAHILSQGKVTFTYGRIEMRAKVPVAQGTSQGIWPAFWLRPVDGGLGEIDILEALGSKPGTDWSAGIAHQTLHRDYVGTPSSGFNYQLPGGKSMSDDFHTYAVEWTPTEMRWFVDDVLTRRVTSSELSWYKDAFVGRAFFIRINMAVGGRWPGNVDDATTVFPAQYEIDWVRLYQ